MGTWRIILELIFYTLISFINVLIIMNDLVSFYYKKGKIKEIKKTETIKDKILFLKYRDKIPGLFYFYYYASFVVNTILIITYFIIIAIPEAEIYGKWILIAHFVFNSVWNLIPLIMFWQKNLRVNGYKYDRWLKK